MQELIALLLHLLIILELQTNHPNTKYTLTGIVQSCSYFSKRQIVIEQFAYDSLMCHIRAQKLFVNV